MIRILHFSDLHIGIESYGRPATEEDLATLPDYFAPGEDRGRFVGYSTRLIDFLCAFDELVDHALSHEVDLVLFSGDAYKSREPSQTHQREFAKRISRLANMGVPCFLLVGNHDLPHASYKATAVEIFDTLEVPKVIVADRLGTYQVETRNGPLQVLALPWIRRSSFIARDEVRNLPYDQINRMVEDRLTDLLKDEADRLDRHVPAVISAHVSLDSAKIGTERTMMVGYDHVILRGNMSSLPVDYVALGHIHRRQELFASPPIIYPGSLQRVDFGEEDHEEKGFYIVDIDPGRNVGDRVVSAEFTPVNARKFATVEVAITEEDQDPTATVLKKIATHNLENAIVRVQIEVPAALEPALRERDIRKALDEESKAHFVTAISRIVERPYRTRLGSIHAEAKSPQQLLRLYLDSRELSSERRQKLSDYADDLMREEAIGKDEP